MMFAQEYEAKALDALEMAEQNIVECARRRDMIDDQTVRDALALHHRAAAQVYAMLAVGRALRERRGR